MADEERKIRIPFRGGPWHGRDELVPVSDGRPPYQWNVPLYGFERMDWLYAPEPADMVLRPDPIGSYRLTEDGYRWVGEDRPDWGNPMEVDTLGYELQHHDLNLLGVPERDRAERWVWVFPKRMARSVVVARQIQVIHADVPYPILGLKPHYPTWREVRESFRDLAERLRREIDG